MDENSGFYEGVPFGKWIQNQRKQLYINSRKELADKLGITPSAVTKIERGDRRPSLQVAKKLAEELQIPGEKHGTFLHAAATSGPASLRQNGQSATYGKGTPTYGSRKLRTLAVPPTVQKRRVSQAWLQLCRACRSISLEVIKYRDPKWRDLYLPRTSTLDMFQRFLTSDRNVFVLLGKHDVGKSFFFFSLAESYGAANDAAVLLYRGTSLRSDESLEARLARDLGQHSSGKATRAAWSTVSNTQGPVTVSRPDDLLATIDQLPGMENRRLLLLVDGISENPNARELLQRINDLVTSKPYPWLKVAISSTHDEWHRMLEGGNLLQERYFTPLMPSRQRVASSRRDGKAKVIGVPLEPFSRREVPQAYEKYRSVYRLRPSFSELSEDVRAGLRDPFSMRMFAIQNQSSGSTQPYVYTSSRHVGDQLQLLVDCGTLRDIDVAFLEQELMPLMITEGRYSRKITGWQVTHATSRRGQPLTEQVLDNPSDPNVNRSFQNLREAEILEKHGLAADYEIIFRHDSFFDYFAGRRIAQIAQGQANRTGFYTDRIRQAATGETFLWGALKSALVEEGISGGKPGEDCIIRLCYSIWPHTKEMLVDALTELGRRDKTKAVALLERTIPPAGLPNAWRIAKNATGHLADQVLPGSLHDLLARKGTSRTRTAQDIALESASYLGVRSILLTGLLQPDEPTRTAAIRWTYFLWERDANEGYEILRTISSDVVHGLIPDLNAIASVFALSLAIFFNYKDDVKLVRPLRGIWRKIIEQIFGSKHGGSRMLEALPT